MNEKTRLSMSDRADRIVQRAEQLMREAKSWADFSNDLFSQYGGLVATEFPSMKERRGFYETPQYDRLNQMLLELMNKFGVVEGATPLKSSSRHGTGGDVEPRS